MICKLPGIRCFQIVQEALDRITVLFVPLEDARETALAIENLCRPLIPAGVAVQARPVEDIPLSPDGKIQFVRALQRE